MSFHTLAIQKIKQETADAVSIVFNVPSALQTNYQFKAGQYVTLKTLLQGEEIRRAYSICSAPRSGELRVSVKAVTDGIFSVYATSVLSENDQIEVHEPEGNFVLIPENDKHYLGFAAGSGITPVLSMIKATLEENNSAKFTLIYGNKTESDTMFKSELDALKGKFSNRFTLEYVYSRERVEGCMHGRIDQGMTNLFVQNKYKSSTFDNAFLCGPEDMIHVVSETLQTCGLSESQIAYELFTSSSEEQNTDQIQEGQTEVTVLLDDEKLSFSMKQTDDILSAALRNKVDAPYSCQGGVCSSCLAKVTDGHAVMTKNSILTDGEVEDGYILTCQAHPTSSKITVDFDDV